MDEKSIDIIRGQLAVLTISIAGILVALDKRDREDPRIEITPDNVMWTDLVKYIKAHTFEEADTIEFVAGFDMRTEELESAIGSARKRKLRMDPDKSTAL